MLNYQRVPSGNLLQKAIENGDSFGNLLQFAIDNDHWNSGFSH